jgi:phage terminase large subunit GpA-like protein
VTHVVKGYRKTEWQKNPGQERNEALDCRVYARAAAALVGLDRYAEEHWLEIEAQLKNSVVRSADAVAPEPQTPRPMKWFWARHQRSFWNRDPWRSM